MNEITRSQRWDHLERPRVEALDAILGTPTPCLDHGFIRIVDYMGDEAAITQAARVSYGKGTKSVSEDRGLIRYLLSHRHTTPFEMCEIKLHVKLPIFVARQWIRHRTASVNEYSARYSILAKEFYIPDPRDIMPQSKTNAQGREGALPAEVRNAMVKTIKHQSHGAYDVYQELASGWPWFQDNGDPIPDTGNPAEDDTYRRPHEGDFGMARELARMVVPPNVYTEWYWKVDLHNLLHFLSLRADPHAQMEIRIYAEAICRIVQEWVPTVWEAFEDYRLGAESFSRMEMEVLRQIIMDAPAVQTMMKIQDLNGTDREKNALCRKLGIHKEDQDG